MVGSLSKTLTSYRYSLIAGILTVIFIVVAVSIECFNPTVNPSISES